MQTVKLLYLLCVVCCISSIALGQSPVQTLPADSITQTTVSLHGRFDNTRVADLEFDLWWDPHSGVPTNTQTGTTRIVTGTVTDMWVFVQGLLPGTTWHCRAIGHDSLYKYHFWGNDVVFHTLNDSNSIGFAIPLNLKDSSGLEYGGGVRFGVHTHATYCVDWGLGEILLPPPPPAGIEDFRFVDPHSGSSECMDQGLRFDLRQYVNPTQSDTYDVVFRPLEARYPVTLTWPNLSNYYSGPVQMKDLFGGIIVNVDMKAETSQTITSDLIDHLLIIAMGPINLVGVTIDSIVGNKVSIVGRFNPNGIETSAWFDWGLTSSYGNTTQSRSIGHGTSSVVFSERLDSLQLGTLYRYRAVTKNATGVLYGVDQWFETPSLPMAVKQSTLVVNFTLLQNYPNPFNPTTTIKYTLPHTGHVTLRIYDILGRVVTELVNGTQEAGYKSVQFDASGLACGIYFYRLQAGAFVETKKLVIIR
jgi:hypothetical protein